MACKEVRQEIDGVEYYTQQLPPTQAIPLQVRLMKVIGPGLPHLAKLVQSMGAPLMEAMAKGEKIGPKLLGQDIDLTEALNIIQSIMAKTDEKELMALIEYTVKKARKDGKAIVSIDQTFVSEENGVELLTLFKVFAFVVKTNFAAFIPTLGS